jgi:hypothetical protein
VCHNGFVVVGIQRLRYELLGPLLRAFIAIEIKFLGLGRLELDRKVSFLHGMGPQWSMVPKRIRTLSLKVLHGHRGAAITIGIVSVSLAWIGRGWSLSFEFRYHIHTPFTSYHA